MKMLSYLFLSAVLFSSTSCLKQSGGQHIPGVNGPKVNIQDGKILLTVELEKVNLGAGLTVPLKNLPNSEVSISPGLMGGTIIRASFDLKDVENDRFKVVPPQLLPDGRAFPFTVDGTLPALAVNVPEARNATFYMSNNLFGFFLPIKLSPSFKYDVHYKIKVNGKNYGIVSLMHNDASGEGAGVIVLLTLKDIRDDRSAKKLLKISKRRKSRVY